MLLRPCPQIQNSREICSKRKALIRTSFSITVLRLPQPHRTGHAEIMCALSVLELPRLDWYGRWFSISILNHKIGFRYQFNQMRRLNDQITFPSLRTRTATMSNLIFRTRPLKIRSLNIRVDWDLSPWNSGVWFTYAVVENNNIICVRWDRDM